MPDGKVFSLISSLPSSLSADEPSVFVRMIHRYYAAVRLLADVHAGRTAWAFSRRPAADVRRRRLRGLPVLVYEVSRRAWGLRLRRTNKGSRYRHCPCCLPHMLTASASGLYIFAAQSPTPPIPLFTLRRAPRDAQRKTRGQSGSLLLPCKASSSSASYRFSPAHKHRDSTQ